MKCTAEGGRGDQLSISESENVSELGDVAFADPDGIE